MIELLKIWAIVIPVLIIVLGPPSMLLWMIVNWDG